MYAVIRTGGKQYKVNKGDVIEVEHLRLKGDQTTTDVLPVLVVTDDGKAIHGSKELGDYKVGLKVVGESKGDKVTVFKYRNKSGYASKTGHRQRYSLVEVTSIGGGEDTASAEKPKSTRKKAAPAPEPEAAAGETETATLESNGS